MPHRQTVDFLRRRYAAAILCDDVETACRLRAQLDQLMNPARCAGRLGHAPRPDAPARPPDLLSRPLATPLRAPEDRPPGAGGRAQRLHLVMPVTGLLESPERRLAVTASRDRN